MLLAAIAALLFIDKKYNEELDRTYEYNKWVIENYCAPNGIR
jgi:hypothetical protein